VGHAGSNQVELGQGQRFFVVPKVLGFEILMVLLSDFQYWNQHWDELMAWLQDYPQVSQQGMTLDFADPADLTVFLLKWSPHDCKKSQLML
jgi:hypothetical protein